MTMHGFNKPEKISNVAWKHSAIASHKHGTWKGINLLPKSLCEVQIINNHKLSDLFLPVFKRKMWGKNVNTLKCTMSINFFFTSN